MKNILIIENDNRTIELISNVLIENNYKTLNALTLSDGFYKLQNESIDGIILDCLIEGKSGFDLLKKIRNNNNFRKIPILILSKKTDDIDLILGLEIGADDYMYKPFNRRELVARLNSIYRRIEFDTQKNDKILNLGNTKINLDSHIVYKNSIEFQLTPKEYELLNLFTKNPSKIFTRDELLSKLWTEEVAYTSRTIDMHIRNLREKIEDEPSKPMLIETIRGYGYRFKMDFQNKL